MRKRELASALACVRDVAVAAPNAGSAALHLDKTKVRIEFHILESGGAIDIDCKDPDDLATRASLTSFGHSLGHALHAGDIEALDSIVPTSDDFAAWVRRTGGVGFSVIEQPSGIRIDMSSSGQAPRTAIHQFISRARGTPLTSEEKRLNRPGNELGRDAPPADPLK